MREKKRSIQRNNGEGEVIADNSSPVAVVVAASGRVSVTAGGRSGVPVQKNVGDVAERCFYGHQRFACIKGRRPITHVVKKGSKHFRTEKLRKKKKKR